MWQLLENKARFINQVMNGSVTLRQAEDLEGGAFTYAEIKAIASGNPAVMEKVKVDTEIRKLDQLRASHINQQHNIRWQIKSLPEQIERARKYYAAVSADILTRDARADEEFTMKVGSREFSGKGAREDAGNALNTVILSWRDDMTPQVRARFKGFEILGRGSAQKDGEPELFVRGKENYKANLNPENPPQGSSRQAGTAKRLSRSRQARGANRRRASRGYGVECSRAAVACLNAEEILCPGRGCVVTNDALKFAFRAEGVCWCEDLSPESGPATANRFALTS
jgi:hypothetical protein